MRILKMMSSQMSFLALSIFCIISRAAGAGDITKWKYQSYNGYDCPYVREKLTENPSNWQPTPECNDDGTFQEIQCATKPPFPYSCMCVRPNGLTVSGMGTGQKYSCVCPKTNDDLARKPIVKGEIYSYQCLSTGYFAPLQCNYQKGECFCVDPEGNAVTPPTNGTISCDSVASSTIPADPSGNSSPPGGI